MSVAERILALLPAGDASFSPEALDGIEDLLEDAFDAGELPAALADASALAAALRRRGAVAAAAALAEVLTGFADVAPEL